MIAAAVLFFEGGTVMIRRIRVRSQRRNQVGWERSLKCGWAEVFTPTMQLCDWPCWNSPGLCRVSWETRGELCVVVGMNVTGCSFASGSRRLTGGCFCSCRLGNRLFETHPECKDVFFLFRDVEDLERLRTSRELRAHGLRSVTIRQLKHVVCDTVSRLISVYTERSNLSG